MDGQQTPTPQRIAELIHSVESPTPLTHNRAVERLLDMGEVIREPVKKAIEQSSDMRGKQRLQFLLSRVNQERIGFGRIACV